LEANTAPAIASEANPAARRPKLRPKKCANRTTRRRLRQPVIGSSNPATPDVPDMAALRATFRDGRGINTVSMSTSEFVGALDSGTLHFPANGGNSSATVSCPQIERVCRRLFCVVLARSGRAHRCVHESNTRAMELCHNIANRCLHLGDQSPRRRSFEEHNRPVKGPTAARLTACLPSASGCSMVGLIEWCPVEALGTSGQANETKS
jgi:hypothetical protein